ncbi:hypothetical protein V8C35DRAFT_220389 [Trichoderma chlorosporum]
MPVDFKRYAVLLQLIEDESERQSEAQWYIWDLIEHISSLKNSYFNFVLSGDNLNLYDFERYRHAILEFAETTCYLSNEERKSTFSLEEKYLCDITTFFIERRARPSLNSCRLRGLLSNAILFNLSTIKSYTYHKSLRRQIKKVKCTRFNCYRCFPPTASDDLIADRRRKHCKKRSSTSRAALMRSAASASSNADTRQTVRECIKEYFSHGNGLCPNN